MRKTTLLLVLLNIISTTIYADDSAVRNVGGSIKPMDGHPTVRLVAEHIHARIHRKYADVECVFFLQNNGPATTVLMGFPDISGGAVGRQSDGRHFDFFESFVDGKKMDVSCVGPYEEIAGYRFWWVKEVDFAEGEVRIVRDIYRGGLGSNTAGEMYFQYVLHTGSSWAGTIGSISVVFTFVDFEAHLVTSIGPIGYEKGKTEIRWAFHDYEPDPDYEVIKVLWKETPETEIESDIHRRAAIGDIDGLRILLEEGENINKVRKQGKSPLIDAVWFGAGPEVVRFLVENGADVNFRVAGWGPPLRTALIAGERKHYPFTIEIVRILLENGAEVTEDMSYSIDNAPIEIRLLIDKYYPLERSN